MAGAEKVAMANPWTAAYHEAGHAVMATLRGIKFSGVILKVEDVTVGLVEGDDEPPRTAHTQAERELLEKHVLFGLAGWAAQAIVDPLSLKLMCMHWSDRDKATALLRCLVSEGATKSGLPN